MAISETSASLSVAELQTLFKGRVIGPRDPDYDTARQVMYGGIDRRPALIVRVADADDVAAVIRFARDSGLPLAVRSGGHSLTGASVVDDGVVLDLAAMRQLDIDPAAKTVWAETGLTAAEVTRAADARGLGIGFGDTGSVGIGGITLGGGVGYLARKFGLTIDNLLAADVVTADGSLVRTDEESHPDLFWAIRGGGGNFGVATRFRYQLHDLGDVVGGMLLLPATPEVIAGYMRLSEEAPEELSSIANVMPVLPLPFVPAEHHGKLGIMALMAHVGDAEAGVGALAPFRALAQPFADQLRLIRYPEMYPPEDPEYHPLAVSRTMFMDHVDLSDAERIVQALNAIEAPVKAVQLRTLGGAVSRVAAEATAYSHRSSRIMVNVAAFHDGTPDDLAAKTEWVDRTSSTLYQGEDGVYVNFVGDEGPEGVRRAYPGSTYERLAQIKRRYDPDNLFRLNQNIPPARG